MTDHKNRKTDFVPWLVGLAPDFDEQLYDLRKLSYAAPNAGHRLAHSAYGRAKDAFAEADIRDFDDEAERQVKSAIVELSAALDSARGFGSNSGTVRVASCLDEIAEVLETA